MESRRTVLMNLFAGRAAIETRIQRRNAGHSRGKERVEQIQGVALI